MDDDTYCITRFYFDESHPDHHKVVKTGLTLDEAKEHCQSDDSELRDSDGHAIWFDGFTKE